jgi:hypothetical protein
MSTDLEEALTASGVGALIQKQIDPLLLDYQRRYAPLVRSIPSKKWGSTVYNWNTRTSRVAGGFVTDGGARPQSASVYTQAPVTIRNMQAVGGVTGYAQAVTGDLIGDLERAEIESAVQGLYWDIETALDWGCSGATALGPWPQFDGIDVQCSTFSGSASNAMDEAGAALALRHFDLLIDNVESNAAMAVQDATWMFVVSSTANSKVAQLLTNQQRYVDKVEIAAGLIVPTYRDVPLVKSSFLGAKVGSMGIVTTATATTGGTLAAGTRYYRVSAIMARSGELQPCAEVSQVTTGSTSTATLSFTPPVGVDGASPLLYKVFASSATGTESLLGYVDAVVGLQGDGITPIYATSIVDTGSALVPQNGATIPASTPATYIGTNAGLLPRAAGGEDMYLMARDPNFVVRPYVREVMPVPVAANVTAPDTMPFALVSDTALAVRAPKYMARVRNVVCSL